MIKESLAYRPSAAGHGEPGNRGRDYVKPRQDLVDAFGKWLDEMPMDARGKERELYDSALGMMPDLYHATDKEVNSVLPVFECHPRIKSAGLFLSAAYNMLDQDELVFDADSPETGYVGLMLKDGKVLANTGRVGGELGLCAYGAVFNFGRAGCGFGSLSSGTAINYGEVGDDSGSRAPGIFINYGKAGAGLGEKAAGVVINYGDTIDWLGWRAPGIVINCGDTGEHLGVGVETGIAIAAKMPEGALQCRHTGLFIEESECKSVPGLLRYLDNIKERLGPARPRQEVFAALKGLDVEADIRKMLFEAGRI